MANDHRPDRRARSDYDDHHGLRYRLSLAWFTFRYMLWALMLWVFLVLRATMLTVQRLLGSVVCLCRGHRDVDIALLGTKARVRWCPTCQRVEWVD